MNFDKRFKNDKGEYINISLIGFFRVPDLDKEYIMYSLINENNNSDMGAVILGEVVREDEDIKILGIKSEERDLVIAYYKEISVQLGGE